MNSALTAVSKTGYRSVLASAIGVGAYAAFLYVKTLPFLFDADSMQLWKTLVAANLLEIVFWAVWMAKRHGKLQAAPFCALPAVCSGYTALSLLILALGLNLYPFEESTVRLGMVLQSIMATNLWAFTACFISRETSEQFGANVASFINRLSVARIGVWLFIFAGLILSVSYVAHFYLSGAAALAGGGLQREEMLVAMSAGKGWVLSDAIILWIAAAAILTLGKSARAALTRTDMIGLVLVIGIFFSVYIVIGNRRQLLSVVVLICMVAIFTGRAKLVGWLLPGAILLGLVAGVARTFTAETLGSTDTVTLLSNMFSEAILPNYPLLYHISSPHELWWGSSLLRLPEYMIPNFGLWTKPLTLNEVFADEYTGGLMSYAYTPLAEGYANFGAAGAFIVPLMISLTTRVAASRRGWAMVVALVYFSLPFDICRGEFISIATEMVIYSTLLFSFLGLCRVLGHFNSRGSQL